MPSSDQRRIHEDSDGLKIYETPGVRPRVLLLALALALVGVAVVFIIRPLLRPSIDLSAEPPPGAAVVRKGDSRPADAARSFVHPPRAARAARADATDGKKPSTTGQEGVAAESPSTSTRDAVEPPSQDDPVFGTGVAEEGTGILAFPPPGTKPIKVGIVVPEQFDLPPGYVRHYQTTDDGRQLQAILMFHPNYQPVDEHGQPVPLPPDRIVPPALAPPGLAIQMLEVPENQPAAREAIDDGSAPASHP